MVASSATALAPLSQNSAVCRCSGSGSGQAQLMQSKPSVWLSLSNVRAVRAGEAVFEITVVCDPCHSMDELRDGLRTKLEGKQIRLEYARG